VKRGGFAEAVPLDTEWESLTNMQALETIRRNTSSQGVTIGAVGHGKLPVTFLFKALGGEIGILEIIEHMPLQVKIRYKLVLDVAATQGASRKPSAFKPIPAEAARLVAEMKGLPDSPEFAGKAITSLEVMKELLAEVAKRTAAIEQLLSGTAAESLMKQQKELMRMALT